MIIDEHISAKAQTAAHPPTQVGPIVPYWSVRGAHTFHKPGV